MRIANQADRQQAVSILTSAFDENKSVNYVVKQDEHRIARISQLMEYSFDYCREFGDVYISDDSKACALVLFPDRKKTTLKTMFWDAKLASKVIGFGRVMQVLKRESLIKQNHPKAPITYLWFIGVDPQHQGKGAGSQLLKDVINMNEKKQRPIYLETSVDKNLEWYRSFGFEIYKKLELSYSLFLLRRVAHPPGQVPQPQLASTNQIS
jgi:ribosomal protein S18 acetylase RimI-like enzyme